MQNIDYKEKKIKEEIINGGLHEIISKNHLESSKDLLNELQRDDKLQ